MAAEKIRKTELPKQLEALRTALVEGTENKRVVVIIDELDRCHPEYAIAFLEATKLIFGQSGFVFCLMMNAEYLESLARHRFGVAKEDEKYIDKFVDIRLKLDPQPEVFKTAVYDLAFDLPLKIPYGEDAAFSMESAAELASILAVECGFSMRKTKRILLKVEIALRCYSDRALDAPLLIFMAFKDESPSKVNQAHLPRSFLTPEEGKAQSREEMYLSDLDDAINRNNRKSSVLRKMAPELLNLPADRYFNPRDVDYQPWALGFVALAPHYIPSHRSVLDGVASVLVSEDLS
jgi:hypothetical protein